MAAFPPSTPAFFSLRLRVCQSIELYNSRNEKKSSVQVGLQILHKNKICQNDNIVKINTKCQTERSRSLFITKQQLLASHNFPSLLQSLSSYDKLVLQTQELSCR